MHFGQPGIEIGLVTQDAMRRCEGLHLGFELLGCQGDPYLLLADYAGYMTCQDAVSAAFRDTETWTRMSILNTARMGKFSSDRSIAEYCRDIWQVNPLPIEAGA